MPEKAYFGAKTSVLGPSILTILGGSFGTHISENHLVTSIVLFFWSDMASNGPERPMSGQKCQFSVKNPFEGQLPSILFQNQGGSRFLGYGKNEGRNGNFSEQMAKISLKSPKIVFF